MNRDNEIITAGRILSMYRTRNRYTQQAVFAGICSKTTYSRIENDEREMDLYLLEYLFGRLGISIEEQDVMISSGDEKMYRLRTDIKACLFMRQFEKAEALLDQYGSTVTSGPIYRQFELYHRGVLQYEWRQNTEIAVSLIREAILLTNDTDTYVEGRLYTGIEMDALIFLIYFGHSASKEMPLRQLLQYVRSEYNGEMQTKYEGKICYWLSRYLKDKGQLKEALQEAEQAVAIISGGREISLLADTHFLYAQLLYQSSMNRKTRRQRKAILDECRMSYHLYALYDEAASYRVRSFVEDTIHGVL